EAEPPVVAAPYGGAGLMRALRQHHHADRMIDAAEGLHRLRGQPDLVADQLAMLGAQQLDILVLDVVGVRHGCEARAGVECLEPDARLVLAQQRRGGAAGFGFLHHDLLFRRSYPGNHGGQMSGFEVRPSICSRRPRALRSLLVDQAVDHIDWYAIRLPITQGHCDLACGESTTQGRAASHLLDNFRKTEDPFVHLLLLAMFDRYNLCGHRFPCLSTASVWALRGTVQLNGG